MYARIISDVAVDVSAEPAASFHPVLAAEFVNVPDDVRAGWRRKNSEWLAPEAASEPEPVPVDLPAYAASKRYAVETGGITFNGAPIDTSRESQALVTGAHVYVQANPDAEMRWKTNKGFVTLDAAEIIALATAVAGHVQTAFAAEADVLAAIEAGHITTVAGIEAWPWPGSA